MPFGAWNMNFLLEFSFSTSLQFKDSTSLLNLKQLLPFIHQKKYSPYWIISNDAESEEWKQKKKIFISCVRYTRYELSPIHIFRKTFCFYEQDMIWDSTWIFLTIYIIRINMWFNLVFRERIRYSQDGIFLLILLRYSCS